MFPNPNFELLLVEDNPSDVRLIQEGMKGATNQTLHVCSSGTEALRFLRRENIFAGAPIPNLVLLDLNLPQLDGREVLRQMKGDDRLCQIPVLVLTTSESQRDVNLAYQLGANCFLTKPQDLDDFFALMESIQDFWMARAQYPEFNG